MFSVDSNGVVRIVPERTLPLGWQDISVELLDTICDYLPQQRELLPMREVSKHWNSVVNSVLERRTLKQWTVWQPFVYDVMFTSPFPFLNLGIREYFDPTGGIDYQRFSNVFENVDVNLFPNNSLYFKAYPVAVNTHRMVEYSVHGFLSCHGAHLTSLKLVMTAVAPAKFYKLLQQMPHLKALTLRFAPVSNQPSNLYEDEELLLPPSPCPQLQYLRLFESPNDEPAQYMWLVKLFATQLLSLEVDRINFCQLNLHFLKLQRLKIIYPPTEPFMGSVSNFGAPLQMLSFHQYCFQQLSITELLRFMHNFTESLVHLCLQLEKVDDDVDNLECPVFSKVTTFAIEDIDFGIVRQHFQPRLTNLVTLQLLSFHDQLGEDAPEEERRKKAVDFCRNAGLWILFPKLKTIEIYPYTSDRDQILSFVLTRNE